MSTTTHTGHKKHYGIEIKIKALQRYNKGDISLRRLAAQLKGPSHETIRRWARYAQEGYDAFMCPLKREHKRKTLPASTIKDPWQRIEELERENSELELDNAILEETIKLLKKDPRVGTARLSNTEKTMLTDALRNDFSPKRLFARLCLSPSSYYYCKKACKKADRYLGLTGKVREVFFASNGAYGSWRIWRELKGQGIKVSEKIIRRLMRQEGLIIKTKRKKPWSSYVKGLGQGPDNLIKRDFSAPLPNVKWLTDITEMATADTKVYLSPTIDCFDGMVVAYTTGIRPLAQLSDTMLKKAIATLRTDEHPILHSDQGATYFAKSWRRLADQAGITRSMSAKGCSPDNSACEGFFGRLKNEMYHGKGFENKTSQELIDAIDAYIEWYNHTRIKKSLGGISIYQNRVNLGLTA